MDDTQKFLQAELKHSPSIQYAFFDTVSILYSFQNGFGDLKNKRPADAVTTYNLFSVTKTFTALAVLQLAEKGFLNLSDTIRKYLPAIPYEKAISIEELLTHSSGLPNPLPLQWTHLLADHDAFDRDLFFKKVFDKHIHLKYEPGTRFSYSNLNYVLLGQLIEKITGKRYETFIKENILDVAGVPGTDLGFNIDPVVHAKGYQKYWSIMNALLGLMVDKHKVMDRREGGWKPFRHFYVNGTPYGGLTGTLQGLVKYGQCLLEENSPLISDQWRRLLFSENYINNKPTGMARAWFAGSFNGHSYVTHAGGGGGYYVELRLYPELGKGSVILNNRTGMSDERMLDKVDCFFL